MRESRGKTEDKGGFGGRGLVPPPGPEGPVTAGASGKTFLTGPPRPAAAGGALHFVVRVVSRCVKVAAG